MELNALSYVVRGCIFKVHATLGPGLLESVYEAALAHELRKADLDIETQLGLPVYYDNIELEIGFRIDILVEDTLIIEIKSVEALQNVHKKQLLTYLKIAGRPLGLLVNFNSDSLTEKESLFRIINTL